MEYFDQGAESQKRKYAFKCHRKVRLQARQLEAQYIIPACDRNAPWSSQTPVLLAECGRWCRRRRAATWRIR